MKLKNFLWWNYQPTDEREYALYAKAYQRSFNTLAACIGLLAWFLLLMPWVYIAETMPWLKFLFYPHVLGLILFLMVLGSYLWGTSQFKGEELVQRLTVKSPAVNYMVGIAVLILLSLVFSLFDDSYNWLLRDWPF